MTSQEPSQVAASNAAQAQMWNGPTGQHWADEAEQFDRMVAPFHADLFHAAAPSDLDRVLDIGCGTGHSSCDLGYAVGNGSVLGVDISAAMLDVARQRVAAAGLGNVVFREADAQVAAFDPPPFDIVVSRFGGMFFSDPVAAYANIREAVRDGGRLALTVWRAVKENQWMLELIKALSAGRPLPKREPGAPGPFAFAEPDRVHQVLQDAGWRDVMLQPTEHQVQVGADAEEALRIGVGLGEWIIEDYDEADRAAAVDRLRARYDELTGPHGVEVEAAAWVVTAHR